MTNPISTILAVIESKASAFVTWWKGTTIGNEIDTAAEDAKAELEAILPGDLEQIAATTATAMLPSLVTGNYAAAIAAGVTTAEAGFKAAEASVASSTVGTFANIVGKQVLAQQTATPATSAAAS